MRKMMMRKKTMTKMRRRMMSEVSDYLIAL